MIKAPGLSLLVEGLDGVADNGAVGSADVLGTGFEDRLPLGFVNWDVAFLKTVEANVPGRGISFIVSEEAGEGGECLVQKIDLGVVISVKVRKRRRKRMVTMGDANTIMEVH